MLLDMAVLYWTVCTVLYSDVLKRTVLSDYAVLYCTVLYCRVLSDSAVLYCTVLYCTVQCCQTVLFPDGQCNILQSCKVQGKTVQVSTINYS